ncbi:MAG: tetratricopeptide repeat protein [Thermodesulfovibrionales bacterium]
MWRSPVSFKPGWHILMLLVLFGVALSCAKEDKAPEKAAAVATNPYSNESVFDELKKKTDRDPEDPEALYHLADLYERNSQYAEAIETYRKVIKLDPKSGINMGYVHFKIATALDRTNHAAKAVDEFKKAIKYLPEYPVLYNNMGVAYGKLGRLDDEIAALKKALRLRPPYSSARYNLGIAYMKKKNTKAAMIEYEALKDYDEGAAEALLKEIKAGP